MHGRVCLVTGASAGIGLWTALGLARLGADVCLVGRDAERTAAVTARVRAGAAGGEVTHQVANFSSLEDVRALAARIEARLPALHVLVNNAGLWHQKRQLSRDGHEDTMAVNHLAPFLLTNLLLPLLRRSAPARVVTVSSRLHRKPRRHDMDDLMSERGYRGLAAYARSKLANVLFSNELARRLHGSGVTSNSLHPGDVATSIVRDSRVLSWGLRLVRPFIKSPEDGARTTLHVATASELEGVTGRYFADCRERTPGALALDPQLACGLWQVSEQLTGLGTGAT